MLTMLIVFHWYSKKRLEVGGRIVNPAFRTQSSVLTVSKPQTRGQHTAHPQMLHEFRHQLQCVHLCKLLCALKEVSVSGCVCVTILCCLPFKGGVFILISNVSKERHKGSSHPNITT